jgi:predicted ATPase
VGVLVGKLGMYELARLLENLDVPVSIQGVLAERIDRLPSIDKGFLQSGAVIGRVLPLRLLQRVVDIAEVELRAALERLRDADFLYEVTSSSEPAYTFKHALTQDVAYAVYSTSSVAPSIVAS